MKRKKRIIIGLVGPFGSGKTSVASYLTKKGFVAIKLSSFLEKEARERYGKIDRKGLQDIGNEFRGKYGPGVLAQWAIAKAGNKSKIVIDGIRNLAEIKFLKKQNNFFLFGVTADPKVRFRRLAKIKTKNLPTWREFLRLDARDKGRGQGKFGLQIAKCLTKADYLIENNESLKELYQKIDEFLKSL